jgi:hypothetical protein
MHGPIDYIVVGFEGNKFDGSILESLGEAVDSGVIRVVALAIVMRDEADQVTSMTVGESGDDYLVEFSQKYVSDGQEVDQDDIDEVAELLAPNTAAGLLVIEQLWAKPLKEALIKANGVLIAEGRIHPDAASELN